MHAVSRGQGHGLALTLARGTAADADVVAPSYKHHKGEDHETGTVHDTHGGGYGVYETGLALSLSRVTAADADVVAPSYIHHKGEDHESGSVHDTHGGGYVVYRVRDVERADAGAGGDGGNGRGRRGATGRVRSCAIARCACP